MSDLISLREYAAMHSVARDTLYRRVRAGIQPGGQLINGEWYIASSAPLVPVVTRSHAAPAPAFDPADYVTVDETAARWGLTVSAVSHACRSGRVPGAIKPAKRWLIPRHVLDEPPEDRRVISGKYRDWRRKVPAGGDADV